jgi:hypothetical protein
VVSAVYDRASISLGQFHYNTKGFRDNNDQTHNIYNAFMQYEVSPKFNIQTEFRTRNQNQGDLLFNFEVENFSKEARRNIKEDTARFGGLLKLTPNQEIIFSTIYTHRDEKTRASIVENIPLFLANAAIESYQIEAQHLFSSNLFNITTGGGIYRTDRDDDFGNNAHPAICQTFGGCKKIGTKREQNNAYLYSNWNATRDIAATVGFSYNSFYADRAGVKIRKDELDPKIGLQVNINENLRWRLAWFEVFKRDSQATIEPTQIAGFNQFYDEPIGTRSRRKAIGVDARIMGDVYAGIEVSERDLTVPIRNRDRSDKQREQLFRTYIYGTLYSNWTIAIEPEFEKLNRKGVFPNEPNQLHTLSAPISINYFNQNGFLARAAGTYVKQRINRNKDKDKDNDTSNFFLLDMLMGFRLPNRRGLISFEAKNMLDKKFDYRNQHLFLDSEFIFTPYTPGRTIFGRATLNF